MGIHIWRNLYEAKSNKKTRVYKFEKKHLIWGPIDPTFFISPVGGKFLKRRIPSISKQKQKLFRRRAPEFLQQVKNILSHCHGHEKNAKNSSRTVKSVKRKRGKKDRTDLGPSRFIF